jgi:hypothetical protein
MTIAFILKTANLPALGIAVKSPQRNRFLSGERGLVTKSPTPFWGNAQKINFA